MIQPEPEDQPKDNPKLEIAVLRESSNAPLVEELVSNDKLEKKTIFPTVAMIEFVRPKQQEKPVRKPVNYAEIYRPKAINTARPNSVVVNAVRENQGTCPISHTSRNLMEGMLPLGEEPKDGKLLVKELLKLVLLKVPRKNNMYSVDMNNIVPKESLTCLIAKATLDESMICHRRLGHGKQHKASSTKDETSSILKSFITEVENLVDKKKEFSLARTSQQNGIAERRNRTLIKAARTMLADLSYLLHFGLKKLILLVMCRIRYGVVKPHNKTPYELFRGRTLALSFMRPFGCYVTILNTLDYLGKFDGKSDEVFFVGYSMNSKAFRVYNIRTRKVEENLHIRFFEDKPIIIGDGPKWLFDIDVLTKSMNYVLVIASTNSNDLVDGSLFNSSSKNASNDEPQPSSDAGKKDDEGVNKESGIDDQERPENNTQDVNIAGLSINTVSTNINTGSLNINTISPTVTTAALKATHANFFGDEIEVDISNITTTYPVPSTLNRRIHKDHSLDHVIGDVQSSVQTSIMTKTTNEQGFISVVYEGKTHEDLHTCLFACFLSQEEPKKVYRNKKDKRGIMIRNKARLVAQGYTQEEGIDYDEGLKITSSLTEFIKVEKDYMGLTSSSRAWYETYLLFLDSGFQRGQIDWTLFIKRVKSDILLVQVYVDDIIFGSTKKELCTEFENLMHKKFQMSSMASTPMETSKPLMKDKNAKDVDVHLYRSMIGSLMYLTSSRPDIMFVVYACARFQVTPKVSHLHAVKRIFRYLKGQSKLDIWHPKDSLFDLEAYSDSDYACASLDKKSTTGGCQFLGSRLISWQCKKQTIVTNSITKAEYVAAASCCGQETATARTLDNGEIELIATIDGKFKIVTEVSVRRHLQLANCDGISSLPTTEIFEQLSLMGENIPLFPAMIVQVLVVQDEGSTHPSLVEDEAASTSVDVRYGGATTTITGLEVEQGSVQQELMVFCTTLSKKVESLETNLKQTKLTNDDAYTKLIKKDPSKQGRKIVEIDQDPAILLVQHDAKIQGRHEHDMEFDFDLDAAKDVSTVEKDVSTAKPVSTAGAAVTTASVAVSTAKNKGKAKMDESKSKTTQTKTKLQQEQEILGYEAAVRLQVELEEEERQRIARVHEATNSFNVKEWEDIQARVEADEELAHRLQAEEREVYIEAEQARMIVELINQRKRYFVAQRAEERRNNPPMQAQQRIYMSNYIKHIGESGIERVTPELAAGSSKRDAEEELDQEMMLWSLVKEKFNSTKPTDGKEREIWVKLKRLFKPDTDDELWKLQKHIHDLTLKLYDSCGVHYVSTEKGIDIYMLVEKDYPLSRGTLTLILKEKDILSLEKHVTTEEVYDALMKMAPTKAPRLDVSHSFNTNGKVASHVTPARGLCQGDPISSYLFIMCAEVLSSMIRKLVTQGYIYGIKVLSGKVINYEKPEVSFGANVKPYVRTHIIESLEVREVTIKPKYLGLPSVIGRSKKVVFQAIIDKIKKQLQGWKGKTLSIGGKEVLMKPVA
ncbi:putative ribonuclease H-like domain-containing protein [Tanacetum coccineum]